MSRTQFNHRVETALRAVMADTDSYARTQAEAAKIAADIAATKPSFRYGGNAASGAVNRGAGTADKYQLDRWGNVVSLTDVRNADWKTTYTYDANNMVVQQVQLGGYTDPDTGKVSDIVTGSGYDALGRLVLSTDGRGNTNRQQYDAAGNLVKEVHADGGVVEYKVDLFGQRLSATQYLNNNVYASTASVVTGYDYDRLGHVIRTYSAPVQAWRADDRLHRTGSTDSSDMTAISLGAAAVETRYGYDELGRRILTTSAASDASVQTVTSQVRYDAAGHIRSTRDVFGYVSSSTWDNFGHQLSATDAMGHTQSWTRDQYGRVLSHVDLEKVETKYTYTSAGQLATARSSRESTNYTYERGTGALIQVDQTLGGVTTTATYGYDLAGNRTTERTAIGARVLQNQVNTIDRFNRLAGIDVSGIKGATYQVAYTFDRNGNRTRERTTYTTDDGKAKDITVTNSFDAMNRENGSSTSTTTVTQRDARTAGHTDTIRSTHAIQYNAMGNRVEDVTNSGTERYFYDDAGRLASVTRDGKEVAMRRYDLAGRVVESLDNGERRVNAYDAGGHLLRQRVRDAGNKYKYDIDYVNYLNEAAPKNIITAAYDALGNNLFYAIYNGNDATGNRTSWANITYGAHGDAWREDATEVANKSGNAVDRVRTDKTYTANNLTRIVQTGKNAGTTVLSYDVEGRILDKRLDGATNNATHILLANGELIGSSDNTNESFSEGIASIVSQADGGTVYTVQSGDTLRAIARAVWGDDNLWYLIAGADTDIDGKLVAGQTLVLPPRITAVNNDYDSFKPYRPAEIVGDTTPQMAAPGKKGCGGIGQIVMVAVAVVATIYTAGALSAQTVGFMEAMSAGATAMTTAGGMSLATGLAAGAAGSLASQTAGIVMRMQDSINWRSVGASALAGGATAGASQLGAQLGGVLGSAGVPGAVARAALGSLAAQSAGSLLGVQSFSWRNIAASAAGAAVGQAAGEALTKAGAFASLGPTLAGIARGSLSGFAAGTAAAIAHGGKIEIARIATDAFGNALGSSLAYANWGGSNDQAVAGAGATNNSAYAERQGTIQGVEVSTTSTWAARASYDSYGGGSDDIRYIVDGPAAAGAAGYDEADVKEGQPYPPSGMTVYQGNSVRYTTSFDSENNVWALETADGRRMPIWSRPWGPSGQFANATSSQGSFEDKIAQLDMSWEAKAAAGTLNRWAELGNIWNADADPLTKARTLWHGLNYVSPTAVTNWEEAQRPTQFAATFNQMTSSPLAAVAAGFKAANGASPEDIYQTTRVMAAGTDLLTALSGFGTPRSNGPAVNAMRGAGPSGPGSYAPQKVAPTTVTFNINSLQATTQSNARTVSSRAAYMGATPSKYSRTGRQVVERMREEGLIVGDGPLVRGNPNNLHLVNPDGTTARIGGNVDMAHKVDAVTWWNEVGRFHGAKAPEVRQFMLDSDNYILQLSGANRSAGAQLRQTYLPPAPPSFNNLKR